MKILTKPSKALISALTLSLVLGACSSTPKRPAGADEVRSKLTQLQSDPQLATRAPVAINEAEAAVKAAEQPNKDIAYGQHLVLIADRKVETAKARAEAKLYEDQRNNLAQQREGDRLEARTREADAARREAEELQRQLTELNAKTTERGIIVTLGDVLFETGKADLKSGTAVNLTKLAAFLNRYADRTVTIEGYTDSVGSDEYNLGLSQRRAESVRGYLLSQGISSSRLAAYGKGESSPVASNDTVSGRQLNRRVEVIIANPAVLKPAL